MEERRLAVEKDARSDRIDGDVPDAERGPEGIRLDRRWDVGGVIVEILVEVERLHGDLQDVEGRPRRRPCVRFTERDRKGGAGDAPRFGNVELLLNLHERLGVGRDERSRIDVQHVLGRHRRRQDGCGHPHRPGGRLRTISLVRGLAHQPLRVAEQDVDVDGVEVRHDVRPGHVDRRRGLEPDRSGQAAVVPPVDDPPRNDIRARPQRDGVDSHGQHVLLSEDERTPDIEGERRAATLVVAEPRAIEPDIGDVVGRPEAQSHRVAGPEARNGEGAPVPGAALAGARRRVDRAGHDCRGPRAIVMVGKMPPTRIGLDGRQRPVAVGQRQVGIECHWFHRPLAVQ